MNSMIYDRYVTVYNFLLFFIPFCGLFYFKVRFSSYRYKNYGMNGQKIKPENQQLKSIKQNMLTGTNSSIERIRTDF